MLANDFAFLDMVDWRTQRLAAGRSGVAGLGFSAKTEEQIAKKKRGLRVKWLKDNALLLGAGALVVVGGGFVLWRRRRAAG